MAYFVKAELQVWPWWRLTSPICWITTKEVEETGRNGSLENKSLSSLGCHCRIWSAVGLQNCGFTCWTAAHDDRGAWSLAVDAQGRTKGRWGRYRGMAGLRDRWNKNNLAWRRRKETEEAHWDKEARFCCSRQETCFAGSLTGKRAERMFCREEPSEVHNANSVGKIHSCHSPLAKI